MLNDVKDFLAKPFSADMSVKGWFAFVLLLMSIIIWWQFILRHITRV